MRRIVVVGGGWAGCLAAWHARRTGAQVLLLERGALGGRGRAPDALGDVLHLGPRAIYRRGPAMQALQAMGVPVTGGAPRAAWGVADWGEGWLPGMPWSMMTSPFLLGGRWTMARVLVGLRGAPAEVSWSAWLDAQGAHGRVRDVLDTLARLVTYAHAPEQVPARVVAQQLLHSLGGVVYADGGWPGLVGQAGDALRRAGVTVREGADVTSVVPSAQGWTVAVGAAEEQADGVVLAVPPAVEARLTGRAHVPGCTVRAACLDLILDHLPRPDRPAALGVGRPLYLAVHSAFARLSPAGHTVVHALRYLGPGEVGARAELEAWVTQVQPGWQDHVLHARFAPQVTVSHGVPAVGAPRLPVAIAPGLTRCGEHVGDAHLLLGAAAASAVEAVRTLGTTALAVAA